MLTARLVAENAGATISTAARSSAGSPGQGAARSAGGGDDPIVTFSTRGRTAMAETIDELGPVDYLVVEFPGSKFNGEIAPVLADLVERDIVRVLDLIMIRKDSNGEFEAFEISEVDDSELGELRRLETEIAELLSEDDVANVAAALEPGSTAGLLVYENRWAAPFASAVRHAGGQLVATGRVPIQALIAAMEADEDEGD
jgi:hypothetical protein